MSDGLLFEIKPIEDPDSAVKQKKGGRKREKESPVAAPLVEEPEEVSYGFLMPIEGHYRCERCGTDLLDLVEIRKVDGKDRWLITCGWWCMHTWLVNPLPGLLDRQEKEGDAFRVRGGRFDGKTFDEIDGLGAGWYIESLVEVSKRTALAEAAAAWLKQKNG